MRPRFTGSAVPTCGLALALLVSLAAGLASAQHGGHTGGHFGVAGPAHHPGGNVTATHHRGATTYGFGGYGAGYGFGGYGAGYGAGYGYGYGMPISPYYSSYASPMGGSLAPFGGGYPLVPAASLAGLAYSAPLHFMGIAPPYDASALDISPPANRPVDNAGHFELILPFEAEVFVNGVQTRQTGFVRHYNTPKLTPGVSYNYQVRVRYVDVHGDIVEETRDLRFKANDWFRVDFTRLPPPTAVTSP